MDSLAREPNGFSLVEMMAVLAILAIVAAIVTASYMGLDRSEGLRGSVQTVRASLHEARQWAVTRGETTTFDFLNLEDPPRGCWSITGRGTGLLGQTNYLARGFKFGNAPAQIRFTAKGGAEGATREGPPGREIQIVESRSTNSLLRATLRVDAVTGGISGGDAP